MPRLSDFALKSLPVPASGQVTYADGNSPLLVRVSQGGAKTFCVMLGSGRRHMIGRYGEVTLQQARAAAVRLKAERTLGRSVPDAMSVSSARELYLAKLCVRPNTMGYYRRHLAKLKGACVADIKTSDITRLLDALPPPSRLQALASLRPFFKWCQARNYIERSPCERLKAPKPPSRDRVLSDDELRRIWRAIDEGVPASDKATDDFRLSDEDPTSRHPAISGLFGEIVKLLILTGQRKSEIACLRNSWIDDEAITLPGDATKNGREHAFPVGAFAAAILNGRRENLTKNALIFPVEGKEGEASFTGWSKAKRSLDKALGDEVPAWTLHDLRRTFATNMARLGVKLEVTEKLLNHVSGSQAGIVGVYQRYNFWPEMVEATRVYEEWLSGLIGRPMPSP